MNSTKSSIFDGLDLIIIAVPHRAFDPLSVQTEMQGRFIHITVKPWDADELRQIIDLGLPALNVIFSEALKDRICDEARGNPLLVQDICYRICDAAGVKGTQKSKVEVLVNDFDRLCRHAAEHSGFPIFERLARGPQSRKDRKPRPLKGGGHVDTYQAILLAVSELSAKSITTYDEIRSVLREILEEGGLPQKNEITSACGHMSSIARNDMENVEPIEWHNDSLVISDPFLLFFMKWQKDEIRSKILASPNINLPLNN